MNLALRVWLAIYMGGITCIIASVFANRAGHWSDIPLVVTALLLLVVAPMSASVIEEVEERRKR